MKTMKEVCLIITLAALSLSSARAQEAIAFVAETRLTGFEVVPPVLTSKKATLTLTFLKLTAKVTGGTLAPKNPWKYGPNQPDNEQSSSNNIRLYFGQHFANGLPIATLCDGDNATIKPDCMSFGGQSASGDFKLSDIQFQGQQVAACCKGQTNVMTILGVTLPVDEQGKIRLQDDDEDGLQAIKALIQRGLIYAVVNSKFTAKVDAGGEIIGYKPPKSGIGDGEIRGTLRLE